MKLIHHKNRISLSLLKKGRISEAIKFFYGIGYWRHKEFSYVLNQIKRFRKKKLRILDVSSPKLLSLYLSKKFNVTAIDLWEKEIEKWKKISKSQNSSLKLAVEDARNLSFNSNSFDIVYSISVIEHVENDKKAVNEMLRVLKKGGILIITSVYNKKYKDIYRYTDSLYSKRYKTKRKIFFERRYDKDKILELIKNADMADISLITERIPYFYRINEKYISKISKIRFLRPLIHLTNNNIIGRINTKFSRKNIFQRKNGVICITLRKN